MNNLAEKPPNAHLLDGIRNPTLDFMDFDANVPNLEVTTQPFTALSTVTMMFDPSPESLSLLGLTLDTCSRLHHAFISQVDRPPIGHSLHASRSKFTGSYIVSVNDSPVFSITDVTRIIDSLHDSPGRPSQVEIVLAPERHSDFDNHPSPLHLHMRDLQHICALQSVSGEGVSSAKYRTALKSFEDDLTLTEMTTVL
jgi:hypothetical protein